MDENMVNSLASDQIQHEIDRRQYHLDKNDTR